MPFIRVLTPFITGRGTSYRGLGYTTRLHYTKFLQKSHSFGGILAGKFLSLLVFGCAELAMPIRVSLMVVV